MSSTNSNSHLALLVAELAAMLPEKYSDDQLGTRLLRRRTETGLSQRQLAIVGGTSAYISRIEIGDRTPSLQLLVKLSMALGTTPQFLATGRDSSVLNYSWETLLMVLVGITDQGDCNRVRAKLAEIRRAADGRGE